MKRISIILMKIGFTFVCFDLGSQNDMFNDGLGYLLVVIGVVLLEGKGWRYFISLVLSLLLAPAAFWIGGMAYFGTASWMLVFARCVLPLVSLPLGIMIVFIICPYTKKGKSGIKQACIFYFLAQVFDIACIAYFIPIRTSMLLDSFNTQAAVILISAALYLFAMLKYLSFFSLNKTVSKKH